MQRRGLVAAAAAAAAIAGPHSALADSGSGGGGISVGGGDGIINSTINVPGSTGGAGPIVQPVGGGNPDGSPAVVCQYVLDTSNQAAHPQDYPGLHDPGHVDGVDGSYYYRYCTDGSAQFAWVPNGTAPSAGVATLTPAQLALEARARLVLSHPTVHRSPDETLRFRGAPYTYVGLASWYWTNAATYRPLSHTLSVGPVSATVTAKPVGLLFDPGDGHKATVCDGPGQAWTNSDADHEAPGGCSYRYERVSDTELPARVEILWQASWTGTGGTGGTLPTMETITAAPLRVLQIQTVNR